MQDDGDEGGGVGGGMREWYGYLASSERLSKLMIGLSKRGETDQVVVVVRGGE